MPRPVHLRGENPPDAVLLVRGGKNSLSHEVVGRAGFSLLSTGAAPHFDIVIADLTDGTIDRLAGCFAMDEANPARA